MSWWPKSWKQLWSTMDGRMYHGMMWARPWLGWLAAATMVVTSSVV